MLVLDIKIYKIIKNIDFILDTLKMNSFNIIENTKTRSNFSEILLAGSLASSMLFFVMKNQKNKLYVLK